MQKNRSNRFTTIIVAVAAVTSCAFGQSKPAHLKGSAGVARYLDFQRDFFHFDADTASNRLAAGAKLQEWSRSFTNGGKSYTYTMVGTDPAGGVSTTIPVEFIPIIFKIGTVTFDPTQAVNQGTNNTINLLKLSPIFSAMDFVEGTVDIGSSQYIDAYQRANFWSEVSTTSPNYHVLLGTPAVRKPITLTVPPAAGKTQSIPNAPYNSTIGEVNVNYFQAQVNKILATTALQIKPNTLPIFVYYNVFFTQGGSCCILGFHGQETATGQTYSVAAYNDPGIFINPDGSPAPIEDIHVIAHEIGEWMDDPSGGNTVPAWGNIGQVSGCQGNLENGDPVTGTAFTVVLNGQTYHPEDLVFHDWFTRLPSTSVNGWYTFLNTFAGSAKACPPGGTN